MAERMKQGKDLGEIMVIAHAVVAAESGQTVTVLIDDGCGAAVATSEIARPAAAEHQRTIRGMYDAGQHADGTAASGGQRASARPGCHAQYLQATARTR